MSTYKPQVGVRLPQDTYNELEQYTEEREITQSDALRQVIDAGLDARQDRGHSGDTDQSRYSPRMELVDGVATMVGALLAAFAVLGLVARLVALGAAFLGFSVWWAPYASPIGVFTVALATIGVNGLLLLLRKWGYLT